MITYFFPDAEERGAAKPTRYHATEPLEDREVFAKMLELNATSVRVTYGTSGATRIGGYER